MMILGVGCPRPAPVPQIETLVVPAPPPEPAPGDSATVLLAAANVALSMPRERQVEEIDRWAASLERTDLPTDRLRLALLLALGDPAVHDSERVRTLLADRSWGPTENGLEALSRSLLELAHERIAGAERAAQHAADLAAEREKRKVLEEQLEALRALEAQINDR